ncbi:4Fe-4S ferredoxin protein [Marine Group I thaumarchaeote SCGC AAA799-D11]|uniref:4Fe-4S ferredoxin protein n=1 Tax=Marine Group I thaumarchaeote SCGC AAA799-D11 TaxID=1502291 RepID=A0A087RNT3_9ARCH|nr:4Fe-4S ferredoxin protein [Marine Group I thaumarchaeote SCGC AAA799-D11]
MPIAILPDIDEQRCIGCALCVEICTTLGPDVLRVKPVEGWKRGKAFVFYPERCISDGACIGVIFNYEKDFFLIFFGNNFTKYFKNSSFLSYLISEN